MRLSAKAQYACVAMVDLACSHGLAQPVHLKDIAAHHGISPRFLVQILLQLKAQGLVESTRGAGGGYQLAKPPTHITLADILHAVDHLAPSMPMALPGLQTTPAVQTLCAVLQDVHHRQEQRLAEITLADLARRSQPMGDPIYQI